MPDTPPETPGQQTQVPAQQAQVNPPQPQGEDWEGRYKGLVPSVQKLTEQVKALQAELAAKVSENERLNGQLGLKDVEKTAAVGERDKTIQELTQTSQSNHTEMARLQALELKVKTAIELKKPELIGLLDTIPNVTDPVALKTIMTSIDDYAAMKVRSRETQLLSGTGMPAGGAPAPSAGPQSQEEWMKAIEKAPLGSKDRASLMDDYGDWLQKTFDRR
jgi:hypothetical protein